MTDRNRIEKLEDTEGKDMADPQTRLDFNGETSEKSRRGSPPGTPLWVKVFAIIAIVLVMLFVILQVVSGGEHGPRRHSPSGSEPGGYTWYLNIAQDLVNYGGDLGGQTPTSIVIEGVTQYSDELGGRALYFSPMKQGVKQR